MRKSFVLAVLTTLCFLAAPSSAQTPNFAIRVFSENEFSTFTKVFGEMRGPLRSQILADRKTDFESADPLKYIMKVKDDRGVKKALSSAGLTWDRFEELLGNILLAYLGIQPQKTKQATIRQLAEYGLFMDLKDIPEEYRPLVTNILKTEEGAGFASAAFDLVVQIPPENVAIVRRHEKDLDRAFYTKHWRNAL